MSARDDEAAQAPAPDEEAFVRAALEALRGLPLCLAERVGPQQISVEHGELELQLSLDGPLRQLRLDPAAGPALIAGLRARVEERLAAAARPDPAQLLPVLRPEALVAARWAGAITPPATPFTQSLWVCYALDQPLHRRMLRRSDADQLGLTDARVHAAAMANLAARASRVELRRVAPGLLQLRLDGDNDAALLLLDHLWGERGVSSAAGGGGALRAVAAADNVLMVILGDDPALVARGQAEAAALAEGALHPLPALLLRRSAGRWVEEGGAAPAQG
jgi:hypothetical protein